MDATLAHDRPASRVLRRQAISTAVGMALGAAAALILLLLATAAGQDLRVHVGAGAAIWWLGARHLAVFTAVVTALAPAIPSQRVTGRLLVAPGAHGGVA